MGNNVVLEYDYYTLEQAADILAAQGLYTIEKARDIVHIEDTRKARSEALRRDLARQKIRKEQMERRHYFIRQKSLGITWFLACSVAAGISGNPTWFLPAALGLPMVFSRKMLIYYRR